MKIPGMKRIKKARSAGITRESGSKVETAMKIVDEFLMVLGTVEAVYGKQEADKLLEDMDKDTIEVLMRRKSTLDNTPVQFSDDGVPLRLL